MRCICCLSNRISSSPLGIEGYYYCVNCGLIFTGRDKRDNIRESLISHYQNIDPHEKVADSKQSFSSSALEYLTSQIGKEEKSILDVGCGYGYFLELAKREGWHTSGVEILHAAVKDSKERVGTNNIFNGSLKEAHYPDNSFDAITLWDVLFMIEEPFEELMESYRILKRKGIIGIRVRNVFFEKIAYRIYYSLNKIDPQLSLKNPSVFHQYCFSSKSIYQLLLRVGFTNIKVTNSLLTEGDPYSYTYIKGLVKAAKRIIELLSKLVFWITGGRWLVGPSLLVWAEKPRSSLKIKRLKPND
jgi:ubiquinone/menaquinone biosynthesis C-methylase UbiE